MAGLGRYLDKHGCPDRADLLLRHVERVDAICRRHGFRPMMWSDTFYRIGGGGYKDDVVTPDIRRRVPPDMQLVAWDYYSAKPEDYAATLESHQRFERDILFARRGVEMAGLCSAYRPQPGAEPDSADGLRGPTA